MGSIVAIVGRPNVGKSTLFNRLTGARNAIVDGQAGVTRDRHYGFVEWNGREFSVIDTGGYITNSDDVFEEEIRKQVVVAVEEADAILFLVDVTCGITDSDDAVAALLRRSSKPVFVVANKVDDLAQSYYIHEFHKIGLGPIYAISAINGSGTGELLDKVTAALPPDTPDEPEEEVLPKIAVVGRPNVGKSSIINAFLGEDRHIVTAVAGTTRDAIHTRYNKFGYDFYLIDTAGLRKKGKVTENLEFYSVMRTIRTIEEADVCILMLDAVRGIEAQDLSIFRIIQRNKKGVVIAVNKWDLVEKDTQTLKKFQENVTERIAPFTDVPIIFTSALTKQRIKQLLDSAMQVYENARRRIPTSKLNEVMQPHIEAQRPPAINGKFVKIKYMTQLPTPCPSFAFFCNYPQYVKEPYKRYLENRLRSEFEFSGVPIQIFIRDKK
ncbi:MAG: ribosome biogenesis GTPase Der [Bacteroidales bacterium]|nr:ribosome biogenesis GTPase Der [Bacteroidales bacterium]